MHVPYCRRRCPYCDFYFEVQRADAGFADAVITELQARAHEATGPAQTLSFGGGTPTALAPAQLARIIAAVRDTVGLVNGAEVSLEANPEDVDADCARGLVDAGFTRASVGTQSFADDILRWLGRAHTAAQACAAVEAFMQVGVSVGVDLIVGVPDEPVARVAADVARAAALGAHHVSTYLLTVETGTPLAGLVQLGKRKAVDDDAQADAYLAVQQELGAQGYAHYEISSHARAGHHSRHNRLYWAHQPYVGLGPGAHSMRIADDGSVQRRHTTARLAPWLADPACAAHDDESLTPAHALREGVAFGLRDLAAGVDLHALMALHRVNGADDVVRALAVGVTRGDVERRGERYHLTPQGARFADRVARDVLAAP